MSLQFLDVFGKSSGGRRQVRTTSGGLVTIFAAILIVWLLVLEVQSYFSVGLEPTLVVDSARDERMDIIVDISFPHVPCTILNVDAMDIAGEVQADVDGQLLMADLGPDGNFADKAILDRQKEIRENAIAARLANPNYKGPCYGAAPDEENCLSCLDVQRAYAAKGWQFHDGSGFDQCKEEGYPEALEANKQNGCRVSGRVSVSKVAGVLHFAPGEPVIGSGRHSHDLSAYNLPSMPFNFDHTIHQLSFGDGGETQLDDPLRGFHGATDQKQFAFHYFAKVVATEFHFLNNTVMSTNQYSVTRHGRPIVGGPDEDHPNSYHASGGIPGVRVDYEISPMKVINTERRTETFSALLMNVCAIIGAVITTAALVDRSVYAMDRVLREKKNR